jgi:hypothetical protein
MAKRTRLVAFRGVFGNDTHGGGLTIVGRSVWLIKCMLDSRLGVQEIALVKRNDFVDHELESKQRLQVKLSCSYSRDDEVAGSMTAIPAI